MTKFRRTPRNILTSRKVLVFNDTTVATPAGGWPERNTPDPIRAWKNAYWTNGEFHAISAGRTYGVDERAMCITNAHPGHQAPQLDCGCGFYAFKDPNNASHILGVWPTGTGLNGDTSLMVAVLLEVSLTGRIIGHTRGYRAERQQIITVYAPDEAFDVNGAEQIEDAHHIPVRHVGQVLEAR